MLDKIRNIAPARELHRRVVVESREAVVVTRNGDVLQIESSGIPIPDGFMRSEGRKHPLVAEHEVMLPQLTIALSFVSFFIL
jgi:hypothetical protein